MPCQNGLKGKDPQKSGNDVKVRNLRGEQVLKLVSSQRFSPKLGMVSLRHGGQRRSGSRWITLDSSSSKESTRLSHSLAL